MAKQGSESARGQIRLAQGERATYRFSILAARQVSSMASIYLNGYGLTGNTWRVLTIIGYYGPMSGTEVSKRASLEPAKVTRAVDLLAGKGYVLRRRDRNDRRKVVLSLSARGRRVYDAIEEIRYEMETELLSALTAGERETLYRVLDKLEARAGEVLVRREGTTNGAAADAPPRKSTKSAQSAGRKNAKTRTAPAERPKRA